MREKGYTARHSAAAYTGEEERAPLISPPSQSKLPHSAYASTPKPRQKVSICLTQTHKGAKHATPNP